MDRDINHYRNPMVTAIGIILGFVLAYLGRWATEPSVHKSDLVVALGFFFGIIFLNIALYRILNNRVDPDHEERYYHLTLKLFMLGIISSFLGTFVTIFQQILL